MLPVRFVPARIKLHAVHAMVHLSLKEWQILIIMYKYSRQKHSQWTKLTMEYTRKLCKPIFIGTIASSREVQLHSEWGTWPIIHGPVNAAVLSLHIKMDDRKSFTHTLLCVALRHCVQWGDIPTYTVKYNVDIRQVMCSCWSCMAMYRSNCSDKSKNNTHVWVFEYSILSNN